MMPPVAPDSFTCILYKIRFRIGLRPTCRWGNLQRSPDLQTGLWGPPSKQKGEGKEREKGEEGKERECLFPLRKFLNPPL